MKRFTIAAVAASLILGACVLLTGCGHSSSGGDTMQAADGKMSDDKMSGDKMSGDKMSGDKMSDGKMTAK